MEWKLCGDGSETVRRWVRTDIKSVGTGGMDVVSVPVQACNRKAGSYGRS